MEKIVSFIERLYNTIFYNGFYILLSIIFPFIIYKMDTGHEIIENILDDHSGLNTSLIIFAFFLVSFSVWSVPTLAIRLWKFVTGNTTSNEVLYQYLCTIYGGTENKQNNKCENNKINLHVQFPIRNVAIFPWALFILTCVTIFSNPIFTFIAAVLMFFAFWFINRNINRIAITYNRWLFKKEVETSERKLMMRYFIFIFIFLFFTFIPAFIELLGQVFESIEIRSTLLIAFNVLQLFAFYTFISYLESMGGKIDAKTRYRISSYSYGFVIVTCIAIIIGLFISNRLCTISMISPIFVVVAITATMILFFDIFFTSQLLLTHIASSIKLACVHGKNCELKVTSSRKLNFYRLFINLSVILFVYIYLFRSMHKHEIREVAVDSTIKQTEVFKDKRPTIEAYFKKWLLNNHQISNSTDTENLEQPINIYLVSGPGGGSRAAVWFYLSMKKLDRKYGDQFYKNIFSISTVSGSTSGANMFLAEKYLQIKDTSALRLSKNIYSKNYFSSAFFGLLVGDGLEGLLGTVSSQTLDRNYYLQKEEMNGFCDAYGLKGKTRQKAQDYFENDIVYPYKNYDFPLFFINTTIIDFGKRGVFAPVKLHPSYSHATDLYQIYASGCCNSGLPMVTCVNQSQAFPLINAYNYLEGAGRLCDGGLYDNSGCTTTLEIYQALRKYIKNNNLKNIRIVCLNINNSMISNEFCPKYTSSSVLNTLTGVASVPFGGHETYSALNLTRQVKNHNYFCPSLTGKYTLKDEVITVDTNKKYNLTRMLSKKSIDKMNKDLNKRIEITYSVLDRKKIVEPIAEVQQAETSSAKR